jgi:hypothetical protein
MKGLTAGSFFGGSMLPIVLFWVFVVATLVVFGVDIAQNRRKNIR